MNYARCNEQKEISSCADFTLTSSFCIILHLLKDKNLDQALSLTQ